jgi:ABC-type multidrug transport system ATPase subunit/pSer/pThr/pTyr-binding forkhead associated (FHA) protein
MFTAIACLKIRNVKAHKVFVMNERQQRQLSSIAYLIGLTGSLTGSRIALQSSLSIIGRDAEHCHILLEQSIISRRHASIEIDSQGKTILTDLTSSHGTFVNDKGVKQCELKDGDKIGFGPLGVIAFTYRTSANDTPFNQLPSTVAPQGFDAASIREKLTASASLAATADLSGRQASKAMPMDLRKLNLPVIKLGRAPDNEIVLEAPGVSRYHASLTYQNSTQPMLADNQSANGTFVNGEPVLQPRLLTPDDIVFIGGFLLRVNGQEIKPYDLSASRISAWQITKQIGNKTILKDISIAINPREFVGLMGPSGCGKSTLMDALNALRPATSGAVYINDLDLYHNFDALRRSIGHVPQRDILHDALTVERTLYYTAKLRLPEGTDEAQIQQTIHEVMDTVGLQEFRTNQFRQLSGGQQKRLSLGIELITKPSFIFLDEPTSPLDPETTENMMVLFRKLADQGRIVVMVTHKFEKFDLMHHVAILTKGGRLAFFGPPQEALRYFGCSEPAEIYRRIATREPDELNQAFQSSAICHRYVNERISEAQALARTTGQLGVTTTEQRGSGRKVGLSQWLTLTRRYLEIKLKDTRNTLLLLLQAPLIAFILSIIAGKTPNDGKTLFIAAIISIWFGANNAVREIVSETPIYVRERLVNLKIPSYVFSKFAVLSSIAFVQCLLFVGILILLERLSSSDFLFLLLILYLTSLGGITMGLFCSAIVNSTEKAMSILPLILIPQLLLSGFLKPLDDVYVATADGKPTTVTEFRRYEDAKNQAPSKQNPGKPVMPVSKREGLGTATYVADVMIARWSMDALAHAVSLEDKKARDALATQMTITEYENVLNNKSESDITSAYRSRLLFDAAVLIGFIAFFLTVTMWALKRKDVL